MAAVPLVQLNQSSTQFSAVHFFNHTLFDATTTIDTNFFGQFMTSRSVGRRAIEVLRQIVTSG